MSQDGEDVTEGRDQLLQSWAPQPLRGESPQTTALPWVLLPAATAPQLTLLSVNTVLWSLLLVPPVSVTISHTARVT